MLGSLRERSVGRGSSTVAAGWRNRRFAT